MSDVEKIAEIAADGVADSMHIIGEEALAAEKMVRAFDGVRLSFLGLGLAIGGAVGALVGFKVAARKLETKYSEIADEEIAGMRQHYADKATAVDLAMTKGSLEALVKEKGYSSESLEPPMAIEPPESVVEAARELAEEDSVNVEEIEARHETEPEVRNIFQEAEIEVEDEWDWHAERARRSPIRPYIIHIDEREEQQAYEAVTYTFYEEDNVLCNERDEVISVEERDKLIGEVHLNKFGHGSGDPYIVYIRNDQIEMDMEVVRSPNSYAKEVHGFDPPEIRHAHRASRRTFDDE